MSETSEGSSNGGKDKSLLDKLLSLFADVEPGEGGTALVLMFNVMLLLIAYYVLKTVREPLILASGGAELKGYATAAQAVLLMAFVPLYSLLSKRLKRMPLITVTLLSYAGIFVLFWVLAQFSVPNLGFAFFLILGVFSLSVIAQFWSLANDLYTSDQGKRLFAILGIGASVGAVLGSFVASKLVKPLGPFPMMLVAAGMLVGCLGLSWWANHRQAQRKQSSGETSEDKPIGGKDGFALLFQDKYLLLVAGLILILNLVNTTGELILDDMLTQTARDMFAPGQSVPDFLASLKTDASLKKQMQGFIGEWRGEFFTWVNLLGALTQMFVVSRVFKYLGVRAALMSLPLIALIAYGGFVFFPVLSFFRIGKIAENSVDYSLYNTTKQALWLPTTREQKYNAKMAIDTFVVRAGDLVSGLAIGVGIERFGGRAFAAVNVAMIAIWIFIAWKLGKVFAARTEDSDGAEAKAAAA